MFNFIFNVLWSMVCGLYGVFMTILTGKLSKISDYHLYHNSHDVNPHKLCSDEFIKTHFPNNVSVKCKARIIEDFLTFANTDSTTLEIKQTYNKFVTYTNILKLSEINEK